MSHPPARRPDRRPAQRPDLDHLLAAGQRLVRTVDGLRGDDWTAPSLLPGWSRAHVVAHLALNGEALRDVLQGVVERRPVPMYESGERRDTDIEELARTDHAEIRTRLLASTTTFADAYQAVPDSAWEGRFDRTADGPSLPLRAVPTMRVREIEIHHVDLAAGYSPDDWPAGWPEGVVDGMAKRLDPARGFVVRPLDVDRTWQVGRVAEDPVVVTGPVAQLAWWLTGRAPGEQVSSSRGELPQIGGW